MCLPLVIFRPTVQLPSPTDMSVGEPDYLGVAPNRTSSKSNFATAADSYNSKKLDEEQGDFLFVSRMKEKLEPTVEENLNPKPWLFSAVSGISSGSWLHLVCQLV